MDREKAAQLLALQSTLSVTTPSFVKHLDNICKRENKSYILSIYNEKSALDVITDTINTLINSLWTLPDMWKELVAQLKETAIINTKTAVRKEIALNAANAISTRSKLITDTNTYITTSINNLRDIAATNNSAVYSELNESVLGQILSDYAEVTSVSAKDILSDIIYNVYQIKAMGSSASSIDMLTLTVLQSLINKYTTIFDNCVTSIQNGSISLQNIRLYTYYLSNYIGDIRFISDYIISISGVITMKLEMILKAIPGTIDSSKFKGDIVDLINLINRNRAFSAIPTPVKTGGGTITSPTLYDFKSGPVNLSLPFVFNGYTFDVSSDIEYYLSLDYSKISDYLMLTSIDSLTSMGGIGDQPGKLWGESLDKQSNILQYMSDNTLIGHWYKAFILNTYNVIKNFITSVSNAGITVDTSVTLPDNTISKLAILDLIEMQKHTIEGYINNQTLQNGETLQSYINDISNQTDLVTAAASELAEVSSNPPWAAKTDDPFPSKSSVLTASTKTINDVNTVLSHI